MFVRLLKSTRVLQHCSEDLETKFSWFATMKKLTTHSVQWYQRSSGERALKHIGHVYYSSIELEEPFKQHFNITGDMSGDTAKNGSLFITNLKTPEHTAVCYCAASYAH